MTKSDWGEFGHGRFDPAELERLLEILKEKQQTLRAYQGFDPRASGNQELGRMIIRMRKREERDFTALHERIRELAGEGSHELRPGRFFRVEDQNIIINETLAGDLPGGTVIPPWGSSQPSDPKPSRDTTLPGDPVIPPWGSGSAKKGRGGRGGGSPPAGGMIGGGGIEF